MDIWEKTIVAYNFRNDKALISEYSFDSVVKPGIYTDLEIDFKEVMKTIGAG